jgi:hypothetical protein
MFPLIFHNPISLIINLFASQRDIFLTTSLVSAIPRRSWSLLGLFSGFSCETRGMKMSFYTVLCKMFIVVLSLPFILLWRETEVLYRINNYLTTLFPGKQKMNNTQHGLEDSICIMSYFDETFEEDDKFQSHFRNMFSTPVLLKRRE